LVGNGLAIIAVVGDHEKRPCSIVKTLFGPVLASDQLRSIVRLHGSLGAFSLVASGVDEDVVSRVILASCELLDGCKWIRRVAVLEEGASAGEVDSETLAVTKDRRDKR